MAGEAKEMRPISAAADPHEILRQAAAHWSPYLGRENYDNTFVPLKVYQEGLKTLRGILKAIPERENERILDAGCGTGHPWWSILQTRGNFGLLYGFDYMLEAILESQKVARTLRHMYHKKVIVIQHNMIDPWPLVNGGYDIVLSLLSDCYLPPGYWRFTIAEKYRVLGDGGWSVSAYLLGDFDFNIDAGPKYFRIENPENTARFKANAMPHLVAIGRMKKEGKLEYPRDEDTLRKQHEQTGFTNVKILPYCADLVANMVYVVAQKEG